MADCFIGEIRMFGGNFAPMGWAFCDGQTLQIAQNDVLYSLLGTTYGGDGQTTFCLPDLRGRVPIHRSSALPIGVKGGTERVTLTTAQIPVHTHQAMAQSLDGDKSAPTSNFWAKAPVNLFSASPPTAPMSAAAIQAAGGNQPHNNLMPFQVVSFIIALEGLYPTQN